jgi:hypothetical protein
VAIEECHDGGRIPRRQRRDLWKDLLERPAGTLAAKSAKNLPARSPPVTARNRADSPSRSNVNAVWPGMVIKDPGVRSTCPSSKRILRLPSRIRRDQATDDQPTGSSGGAGPPNPIGSRSISPRGTPTSSEHVPENAYSSGFGHSG